MDRRTGKPLAGADHVRKSIKDILGTPLVTRIGRRDYGSELPALHRSSRPAHAFRHCRRQAFG